MSKLKLLSVVLFFFITRNNSEHVILPMILVLLTSVLYIFKEFKEALLACLALLGTILVMISIVKTNKYLLVIGYFFTFLILFKSFFDKTLYLNITKELYFFSTSSLYIFLSMYIMARTFIKKK
jgi:hypothetical protein